MARGTNPRPGIPAGHLDGPLGHRRRIVLSIPQAMVFAWPGRPAALELERPFCAGPISSGGPSTDGGNPSRHVARLGLRVFQNRRHVRDRSGVFGAFLRTPRSPGRVQKTGPGTLPALSRSPAARHWTGPHFACLPRSLHRAGSGLGRRRPLGRGHCRSQSPAALGQLFKPSSCHFEPALCP